MIVISLLSHSVYKKSKCAQEIVAPYDDGVMVLLLFLFLVSVSDIVCTKQ